jgi:pimeloyl-ACP methyl ester carboxylesterase
VEPTLTAVMTAGLVAAAEQVSVGATGSGASSGTMEQPAAMPVEVVGSGAPLVLVGGGLTGWASWQPHVERLLATRRVARLQLLAVQYGLENRPLPADYSLRVESSALAAALGRLGWHEPLDLVAWSYGAAITLDYALKHPERVRTLTLIEPPAAWVLDRGAQDDPDVIALRALAAELRAHADVDAAHLERFIRLAALCPPDATPSELPQWPLWYTHRRSLRGLDAPLDHLDDPARLRAFDRPVLLVTGTGTTPFLRRVHDALSAALPNALTSEMPGGHAPQLASMETFLSEMVRFQDRLGGSHEGAVRMVATSRDGTSIAFWRTGHGPPLLLVHGTTADHTTTWRATGPLLEERFTVFAMDRRGRGGSGDSLAYALAREAEDVAAVVDAIGEPVDVLGHSFGALCALEATLLTNNVRRLILYEGVPLAGSDYYLPGSIDAIERLIAQGDVEGGLIALLRDVAGIPDEEVDLLRAQREAWAVRLGNARTAPREMRADEAYVFDAARFRNLRTPTLLLVGGDSPIRELSNARDVAAALARARVRVLPGQQHIAMHTAPESFVDEVARFLGEIGEN